MTTPEIDGAHSTVEGGDKSGANSVTTPVDAKRCKACEGTGSEPAGIVACSFCGGTGEADPAVVSPSPVDAAPPKDPMAEIDARRLEYATACERMGMAHANGTRAEWETAASDEVATRTALLSAVASLRARAEEAERERDAAREGRVALQSQTVRIRLAALGIEGEREGVDTEEIVRDLRSSLERMRERVAGLAEALRGLLAASDDLRSAARTPDADLPFGALRMAENEARSVLHSLENESAPSTPETKDDHR